MARHSKYDEWISARGLIQIEGWARDGLTNKEIAHNVGVNNSTFAGWLVKFKKLKDALEKGREPVLVKLENSMFKSTEGYFVEELTEEWIEDPDGNIKSVKKKRTQKYIPPNPTIQIFMAKNWMPDKYKDKRYDEVKVEKVEQDIVDSVKEYLDGI